MKLVVLGYGQKEIIFGNKKYRENLSHETKSQLQYVLFTRMPDEEFEIMLQSSQQTQANIIYRSCDTNPFTFYMN